MARLSAKIERSSRELCDLREANLGLFGVVIHKILPIYHLFYSLIAGIAGRSIKL